MSRPNSVDVIARLPITYNVLDGGTTHAPLVVASIGGVAPARFVLDTGSDVHLLNEDLVDELGLPKSPGEEGTDHAGATMPSWSVGPVDLALGGLVVSLAGVVSIPAPAAFVTSGIRGILSPQNLHQTAFSVVDMAEDDLVLVEASNDQMAEFLRERSPRGAVLELDREPDRMVVIRAAIEPFADVRTLVDTGGKRTEFAAAAVPGLAGGDVAHLGGGVSGARYEGRFAGPQQLAVGNVRLSVPDLAVRFGDVHPETSGLIGMDVLRGTVVAAAADTQRPLLWRVPAVSAAKMR